MGACEEDDEGVLLEGVEEGGGSSSGYVCTVEGGGGEALVIPHDGVYRLKLFEIDCQKAMEMSCQSSLEPEQGISKVSRGIKRCSEA